MALGGMEQMMVALLGKMGIDPEMVKSVATNVQATTARVNDGLTAQAEATQRIEAKLLVMDGALLSIEAKLDLILSHVEPKPDGGFVIGDGSVEEQAFMGKLGDAVKPWPESVIGPMSMRDALAYHNSHPNDGVEDGEKTEV